MSLFQTIEDDLKQAMKDRDAGKLSTLRMLRSALKNAAIAAKTGAEESLEDSQVQKVVQSEAKKLKDALTDFTSAARDDLIDKTKEELATLQTYLPKELEPSELKRVVTEMIDELKTEGPVEFGKAMKAITAKVKGAADGRKISEAVKEALSKD